VLDYLNTHFELMTYFLQIWTELASLLILISKHADIW